MKTGAFITRSQPIHLGHLSVVQEMDRTQDLDKIVIGIGSSQYSHALDNPFTFEERREMTERTLENRISKPFEIVGVPDIHDYPKWVPHFIKSVPDGSTI